MENIGIVGYGIVGRAVEYGFKEGNEIEFYDRYKDTVTLECVVENSKFIFVCLPTPYKNCKIDLSIMDENIKEIAELVADKEKYIIIKSTVVPGTTRRYSELYKKCHFAFNPEFLTEANYLEDFINPDRIVIGADNDATLLKVVDLYRSCKHFTKTKMFCTDTVSAEMVKYMANCFLSTKVIFANEMYELCEKLGIKYEEVKKMVVADKRIYDSHMDVTTLKGFGGKCFPKDLIAMIGKFEEMNVDCSLLKTVWDKNLKIRKVKDWEEIPFVKGE